MASHVHAIVDAIDVVQKGSNLEEDSCIAQFSTMHCMLHGQNKEQLRCMRLCRLYFTCNGRKAKRLKSRER